MNILIIGDVVGSPGRAIMKKALTPSTVLVPSRYWDFSHAAAKGLIVGDDTSMRDASRVLMALRAASKDEALSLVVPIQSLNYQTSAGSSVTHVHIVASAFGMAPSCSSPAPKRSGVVL